MKPIDLIKKEIDSFIMGGIVVHKKKPYPTKFSFYIDIKDITKRERASDKLQQQIMEYCLVRKLSDITYNKKIHRLNATTDVNVTAFNLEQAQRFNLTY